ncbi:MAG: YheC/YheD family protein [Bacillota bacterium]|nr:YheC/YheD family protein [Bacillota bacterium]
MNIIGQIYVSNLLAEKMGIPDEKRIKVRVGGRLVNTRLVIRSSTRYHYLLSPLLARTLLIKTRSRRLQIRYDRENALIHIGPTIGILASYLPRQEEFDSRSYQAELIYLSKISRTLPAQTFIFTPSSVNWANRTVRGYNYREINREKGTWVSAVYPLPDVVYDRIPSRSGEAKARTQYVKKKLKAQSYLHYFNPAFLNKWKVHSLLTNNKALWPYLPETMLLSSANLEEMTKKYATLYLKPSNGSLGNGIIKVDIKDSGKMNYVIYKKGRTRGSANTPLKLMANIKKAREGKSYIVQQGLNLCTYKNSPFDIRIIYQKNMSGEWKISKKFVRVAPRGSSVANLSRGGQAETTKKVFRKLFSGNASLIEEKSNELQCLCKNVADTLEKYSGDLYGELGLDIGIDISFNLYLIEVNSKPRKTTETEMSQSIVKNTFRRPLEYAMYLAGFGKPVHDREAIITFAEDDANLSD